EDAVARRHEVTGGLDDSAAARRLTGAGVTVLRGTGRISRPGTVEVTLAPGQLAPGQGQAEAKLSLTYADLVLATGCEPVAPPIEGLSDIPAWTTAESLCSPDLPRRLIVLGGGPAGCELTQIYATFGSQVTLVEAEPGLLPGEAAFAGEILAAVLRRAGAEICLGSAATKAERTPEGLTLALGDGTRIDADRLLLASGRRPRLTGPGWSPQPPSGSGAKPTTAPSRAACTPLRRSTRSASSPPQARKKPGPCASRRRAKGPPGTGRSEPIWATPPGPAWAPMTSAASSSTPTPRRACWSVRPRWGRTRSPG